MYLFKHLGSTFLLVITAFIMAGCGDFTPMDVIDEQGVLIKADRQTYQPDQQIEVSIANATRNSVRLYPCLTSLQRKVDGEWVHWEGMLCPAVVPVPSVEIKPGKTFSDKLYWFGGDYEEGEYRILFNIRNEQGETLPEAHRATQTLILEAGAQINVQ